MMKYLPFHYYFVYRHHIWYVHFYIDILIMLIYISTYLVCWNLYWYIWYVHIHIIFLHTWFADTQISIFGMFIYILTFHSYIYIFVTLVFMSPCVCRCTWYIDIYIPTYLVSWYIYWQFWYVNIIIDISYLNFFYNDILGMFIFLIELSFF